MKTNKQTNLLYMGPTESDRPRFCILGGYLFVKFCFEYFENVFEKILRFP